MLNIRLILGNYVYNIIKRFNINSCLITLYDKLANVKTKQKQILLKNESAKEKETKKVKEKTKKEQGKSFF